MPVFENDAIGESFFDSALTGGDGAVCGFDVPLTNPKIELTIFRGVSAGL